MGSWVFLIRDWDGDVVRAGRGKINYLVCSFQAELVACLQGVQSAADLGVSRLIMETDAQEVVRALNSTACDDSVVGHLVDEIKLLLSSNFINFQCVYAGRTCNETAHELASLGYLCIEGEEIISDSILDRISVIVANDLLANE